MVNLESLDFSSLIKAKAGLLAMDQGHSDNLEFSEISEFLKSKIPSSKLSLFALYRKTITRNFFSYVKFSL